MPIRTRKSLIFQHHLVHHGVKDVFFPFKIAIKGDVYKRQAEQISKQAQHASVEYKYILPNGVPCFVGYIKRNKVGSAGGRDVYKRQANHGLEQRLSDAGAPPGQFVELGQFCPGAAVFHCCLLYTSFFPCCVFTDCGALASAPLYPQFWWA